MSDEPHDHVGEVSADGKWRWDGLTWQPVAAAETPVPQSAAAVEPAVPAAPPPPRPPRRYGLGRITAVVVATMIVSGVCGIIVGGAGNSSKSTDQASSSPTPHASASLIATTAQDQALAYAAVVAKDAPVAAAAFGPMSTDCGNQDISKCRSDVAAARTTDQKFLSDLSKLPVPKCLAPAAQEISAALAEAVDAESTVIKGIDANDASQVTEGADFLTLANDHLTKADDLINASPCG